MLNVTSQKNDNPALNLGFGSIALNSSAISDDLVHLSSQTIGKYLIN